MFASKFQLLKASKHYFKYDLYESTFGNHQNHQIKQNEFPTSLTLNQKQKWKFFKLISHHNNNRFTITNYHSQYISILASQSQIHTERIEHNFNLTFKAQIKHASIETSLTPPDNSLIYLYLVHTVKFIE